MHAIKSFFQGEHGHIVTSSVLFVAVLVVIYIIYHFVLGKLKIRVAKTKTVVDDFVIDLLQLPVLWLLFWITFMIFSYYSFLSKTSFYPTLDKINDVLLILTIGWIMIKVVRIIFYYMEQKVITKDPKSIHSRTDLTKMKIFEGITVAILTVVTIGICLMSFDKVRTIGVSLLTSAGIAGIIVGLAAQKSIGAVLAGVQIALTQPIRLDDQVIVDGNSGSIEEITLTYVVVKLWNEERFILPVSYFLENPFLNLTRNSGNILGTVFLYVDYAIPVDELRKQLDVLINNHPKWDKRVSALHVTDCREKCMEIRILLSSNDSAINFDLLADIREKMIVYIQTNYPESFVKTRLSGSIEMQQTTGLEK